jgi:hypothetical protein
VLLSSNSQNSKVTYFHSAITPVIVAPGLEQVMALAPELITPQDGYNKQDCEQAAAKRWLTAHGAEFESTPVTLLGMISTVNSPCES